MSEFNQCSDSMRYIYLFLPFTSTISQILPMAVVNEIVSVVRDLEFFFSVIVKIHDCILESLLSENNRCSDSIRQLINYRLLSAKSSQVMTTADDHGVISGEGWPFLTKMNDITRLLIIDIAVTVVAS